MGRTKNGKVALYFLGLSILLCAWAYSLDTSFVFKQDSFTALSLTETAVTSPLLVATRVIFAVSKPILAKISDVSSRPATYVLVLLFYAVGCILIASSTNAVSNIIGQAFVAVGSSGLETLSDIIVGDLTPLKWRGFMWSLLSLPFIPNFWLSGIIVHMLSTNERRWRYGMFAIIMPVVLSPAILIMLFFQKKAAKLVIIEPRKKLPLKRRVWNFLIQMDALGLLIMTLGWTLLLIPFSLYPLVDNGWKNPSLIAMIVVGGVLLIAYVLYEVYIAPVPSASPRVMFNKTFLMSVVIDFIYMLTGRLITLYLPSYIWIITEWTPLLGKLFTNSITFTVCVFAVVAGVIQKAHAPL